MTIAFGVTALQNCHWSDLMTTTVINHPAGTLIYCIAIAGKHKETGDMKVISVITSAYSKEQAIAFQNEYTIFEHFPGSEWDVIYSCCPLEVPASGKWSYEQD